MVCGGAGGHSAAPGIAEDDLEAGIGGGPCNGGIIEYWAESVPEGYHELVIVRPGPRPVGIVETGNDLHVYVYEEDLIEQPKPEAETAIYSNGTQDAMGYDAHYYHETHQCNQELAYAGQGYTTKNNTTSRCSTPSTASSTASNTTTSTRSSVSGPAGVLL